MIGRRFWNGGVLPVAAAACMWLAIPSPAQNRGVYPLGMSATNSGVMPESTFTYSNQLLLYTRDQAKDKDGQTLPVTGNHLVILDMNTITWVSQESILGARYGASASLPVLEERSDFRPSGQPQRGPWICGLVLSARDPGLELGQGRGSRDVWLPGSHRAIQRGRERQCRFGLLDACPVCRADLLPDREQTAFAVRISDVRIPHRTARHRRSSGRDVRPGLFAHVFTGTHPALPTASGPAGYEQRQTTAKTGPGISLAASEERYAVNGLGFAVLGVLPKRTSVGLKYFKEFANRSTFQGYSLQVVASIGF